MTSRAVEYNYNIPESRQLFINTVLTGLGLRQLGVESLVKVLYSVGFLQLGHVQSLCDLSLGPSLWLDTEANLGDDKAVVSPALGATYGLGHPHVAPVPCLNNDVFDEMPVP